MPDFPRQQSPLASLMTAIRESQDETGLSLSEGPAMGYLNLRGDPAELDFVERVRKGTNIDLPEVPNTSHSSKGISALWLGPHEWLVLVAPGLEIEIQSLLHAVLTNRNYAITDITSGNTSMTLTGVHARELLARGCSIDLHDRLFPPGSCVQTYVAKASVLLWNPDDSSRLDLIARRSFAEYLALWLQDAGSEFGLTLRRHLN
jgi:sarcosine oxidase, subunit gamma